MPPPAPDSDHAAVRHHIAYKTSVRELDPAVAQRMLDALDNGAPADYAALLEQATFLPPPSRCYHTAPAAARDQITTHGLIPGTGQNWNGKAHGQPVGVYVGATPDTRGIWAHWPDWDIWEIDLTDLPWDHDRLNPGNWIIPTAIPAHRLTRWTAGPTPPSANT